MKRIIAGPNQVVEAISAGVTIQVLYLQSGLAQKTASKLFSLASRHHIKTQSVTRQHLEEMARDLNHQGVVAVCGEFQYRALETLLSEIDKTTRQPLLVILDQIQDPGNLGAILRSSHSLGAHGVIITKDRSAQVTAATVRASAGASELIPVVRIVNLVSTIQQLQQDGFQVLGADMDGAISLDEVEWPSKTAIVLGNEGKGIRKLTRENCDLVFKIPMANSFESLNVSASAAIVLYEHQRSRRLCVRL
ncbi:MAG: 23S rRNA (guanosine(2251)-2'-O)-methyltransferase RlmB [Deltaproteobacteria bacterium]|nr:23S rRNA (guanosine(2251)-2'-O)-methyltransferase RlmB [Deltaproteobacteria bacterium]